MTNIKPIIPSPEELDAFRQYAQIIVDGDELPDWIRYSDTKNKIAASEKMKLSRLLMVFLAGWELGIHPQHALETISFLKGVKLVEGELALFLFYRDFPQGELIKVQNDNLGTILQAKRKSTDEKWHEVKFMLTDAKMAGYYPANADSIWAKRPATMMYWRAVGELSRQLFPDILHGAYIKQEREDLFEGKPLNAPAILPDPPKPQQIAKSMDKPALPDKQPDPKVIVEKEAESSPDPSPVVQFEAAVVEDDDFVLVMDDSPAPEPVQTQIVKANHADPKLYLALQDKTLITPENLAKMGEDWFASVTVQEAKEKSIIDKNCMVMDKIVTDLYPTHAKNVMKEYKKILKTAQDNELLAMIYYDAIGIGIELPDRNKIDERYFNEMLVIAKSLEGMADLLKSKNLSKDPVAALELIQKNTAKAGWAMGEVTWGYTYLQKRNLL